MPDWNTPHGHKAGHTRRGAVKRLLVMLALPVAAWCRALLAGERPVPAFRAERVADALQALYGTADIPESDKLRIGMAALAENGAVVPIKVETDLPEVSEIALIATRNPVPLVARFDLPPGTRGFVATRIKLAETSEVLAIARTAGGLVMTRKAVEVTIGGCG